MRCLHCSFQNPDDARFCQNCGQPLSRACPNCETPNAAAARFCKHCGFKFEASATRAAESAELSPTPAAQDPRHARLAAATPAGLAKKMRAAAHQAGERRLVTALFADVVGSTALAEQMDPEDWTAIMNRAFEALVPAIYRYEGTIARLMGDALLAFFGAPVAHEDDPIRAVHAGLDLLEAARNYAGEVRARYGIDFAVRVGMNTGPVVVGQVGSDLAYEYTAMGDAVNLAARMQSAARPMTLLITDHTYRFVAPLFDCRDLGEIAVKGKRAPVRAYEVHGLKAQPESVRGIAGLKSAMVGRQNQLDALMALCTALSAGLGRAALVLGEAGLGKSRLIEEWKAGVAELALESGRHPTWLEGHCLSYGQSMPYHLVTELLLDLLDVTASAEEAEIRLALQARCEELLGEDGAMNVFPYLGHLLSLPLSGEARDRVSGLDPQTLQSQYLAAMSKVLSALADRQPLLVVLEDIHWADPSSIDLLVQLMPLSTQTALLLCAVSRPDREAAGWKLIRAMRDRLGAGLTEIHLRALGEQDAQQLVANLLEIEALPEQVRQTILDKAEGNPFFVEEIIRMLIDQQAIVRQENGWAATREVANIDLPDTVQGLLLARIDRLPEEIRHTLRVASVLGRRFSLKMLEQISTRERQSQPPGAGRAPASSVLEHLHLLESLGLIEIAQVNPELEYRFRHEMVHDVTYRSLVRRDRRALHLAAGEALEGLHPERLAELAPTLGLHFEEGQDDERAVKYLTLAGDQAAGQYANEEAAQFYHRAIRILTGMASAEDDHSRRFIHLYLGRGRALELLGRYERALDNYLEMEAQAHKQNDEEIELASLVARTVIHAVPTPAFDPEAGATCATKALTLAERLDDRTAEAKIHWVLMIQNSIINHPEKARAHGERSLALARQLELPEQRAYTLSDLSNFVYMAQGEFDQGLQALEEARDLWRALGNLPLLSNSVVYKAYINYQIGRFDTALQNTDEAYDISRSINNLWGQAYSLGVSAMVQLELGNADQVVARVEEATRYIDESGFSALKPVALIVQAMLHYELGAAETASQLALEAAQEAEGTLPFWMPTAYGVRASALLRAGDLQSAEQAVERSIEITGEGGTFMNTVIAAIAAAELERSREDFGTALEKAENLLEIAGAAQARTYLPYGLCLKGQALLGLGRLEAAEEMLRDAQQIAGHLGSRRIWWRCLAALAEVHARRGNEEQAEVCRRQAREIVGYIAEHAGSTGLKDSFLGLPEVRQLLG